MTSRVAAVLVCGLFFASRRRSNGFRGVLPAVHPIEGAEKLYECYEIDDTYVYTNVWFDKN